MHLQPSEVEISVTLGRTPIVLVGPAEIAAPDAIDPRSFERAGEVCSAGGVRSNRLC